MGSWLCGIYGGIIDLHLNALLPLIGGVIGQETVWTVTVVFSGIMVTSVYRLSVTS